MHPAAAPQLHGFGISPTSAKRRVLYHNFGQFSGTPEDFRQKPPDFRRQPSGLTGKAPGLSRKRYIPPSIKGIYLLAPKVYTSSLQRHIPPWAKDIYLFASKTYTSLSQGHIYLWRQSPGVFRNRPRGFPKSPGRFSRSPRHSRTGVGSDPSHFLYDAWPKPQ